MIKTGLTAVFASFLMLTDAEMQKMAELHTGTRYENW